MGNISEIKNSQTNRQNTCAVTNKTKDLTKCLRPLNYKQLHNNQAVYMINQETLNYTLYSLNLIQRKNSD